MVPSSFRKSLTQRSAGRRGPQGRRGAAAGGTPHQTPVGRGDVPHEFSKKLEKTKKVESDVKKFPIITAEGEDSHPCDVASQTMPTHRSEPPVTRSTSREGDIPS